MFFGGHSQCDGIDKHVNSFKYQFNHLTDCHFKKYFLEKYPKKMFDKRLRSKSIIWVHYLYFQFLIACKFMCEVILTNIIEKFVFVTNLSNWVCVTWNLGTIYKLFHIQYMCLAEGNTIILWPQFLFFLQLLLLSFNVHPYCWLLFIVVTNSPNESRTSLLHASIEEMPKPGSNCSWKNVWLLQLCSFIFLCVKSIWHNILNNLLSKNKCHFMPFFLVKNNVHNLRTKQGILSFKPHIIKSVNFPILYYVHCSKRKLLL